MVKTKQARIINVSSEAHRFFKLKDINDLKFEKSNPKFLEIYGVSKLCNILFTTELVRKLQPLGNTF
jgi:NAD(P)-dependent dehydrogenase (short-subunit alcohol dehydrogenase family)